MKKNYLLLALLFGWITFSFARQVESGYAMQVAKNFYLQNTGQNPSAVTLHLTYECKTNTNVGRPSDGHTIYYVFNVNETTGFVIVSGEDLVQPILGYNTKGSFKTENMPSNVKGWMDKYKMEIVYVIENVTETTEEITRQWHNYYNNIPKAGNSRATQAVAPLCQTQWNQNPYYNNMCPYDQTAGANCVTGCVATAMAQILKFWNFPAQGTGNHSYNSGNYGTLSANYGANTYDWANMPTAPLSADNTPIESLMSDCGISVDMHYTPQESGAWVITADAQGGASAQNSYTAYFGYNPDSIKGLQRTNYSDQDWTNLMLNELNLSRPIQYVGSGPGGGHTWVCDGYDDNGNFHMNWGWGSADDGYYSLNALNPSSPGTGGGNGSFNSGQEALIGIVPIGNGGGGGGTINQGNIIIGASLVPSASTIAQSSQFTLSTTINNTGTSSFTGDFAAALFNSDGVFNGFVQVFTNQTIAAQGSANATFFLDSLKVIPGNYYVGVYYKDGTHTYSLINQSTFTNPIVIHVTTPYNDIQMYSNDTILPARPMVNQAFDVRVNITNAGASDFTGYLDASLYKLDGTYVTDIQTTVNGTLTAGYYYNLDFHTAGLNVTPGTYYVAFWSSPDNTNWSLVYDLNYPNPVQVTIVSQPLSPDIYEPDNTESNAAILPVNFTGNTATVNTAGSNIHVGNDYDYYKINLPGGTNYSVTPQLQDSKNSSFTDDVVFSYKVNGGSWSNAFASASGPIFVQGGGDVIFFVADNFLGTIGTYELDMNIVSGANVGITETGINDVKIFPNPVNDVLSVNTGDLKGDYEMQIFNTVGEVVKQGSGQFNGQLIQTDVSKFASGMYILKLATTSGIVNSKFIVK